jgi:hypothetical protein
MISRWILEKKPGIGNKVWKGQKEWKAWIEDVTVNNDIDNSAIFPY